MKKYDFIVVGAGLAGLAAAAELCSAGKKVLLIEQHNLPGGCSTSFVRGRFEFDPSLHELCGVGPENDPGEVRKMFDRYGIKIDWKCVDDCFRIISEFSDGTPMDITMPAGKREFMDKLDSCVPGYRDKIENMFRLFDEVNDGLDYVSRPKYSLPKVMIKYTDLLKVGAKSTTQVFDALELPQKIRDILAVYWTYLGVDLNSLSFPHYASMVSNYINRGAYIPAHTSHEISVALTEKIRELGGTVLFNCRAWEFIFEGDRCSAVKTNLGTFECGCVLANINPDIIYGSMMDKKLVPEREKKLSAARNRNFGGRMFTCYLGLNKTAQELGIKDYSIFTASYSDSVKEYNSMRKIDTNKYSIFLCYNVANPGFSPEGTCVCSFTRMFTSPQDWEKMTPQEYFDTKTRIADEFISQLLEKTGIDLRPHIEEISVAGPWTFARYLNTPEGGVYGYETRDWDGIMGRNMSIATDYPIKGLIPIGTSGPRGDGYSSALYCGYQLAGIALSKYGKGGND